MSRRWLTIILIVSLAFNLSVLIMFTHIAVLKKMPFCLPGTKSVTACEDQTSGKYRKVIPRPEEFLDNKAEIKALRDDYLTKRKAFMELMRQEDFNAEEAYAAMQASLQAQDVLEKTLGKSLIEFRKKLTFDEAKTIFKPRIRNRNFRFEQDEADSSR